MYIITKKSLGNSYTAKWQIYRSYLAFTLAEVLITLMVIGVISALTIPALIQRVQKNQYVVALRKAHSTLSQAYNLLKQDGGGDITYVFPGTDDGVTAMNYFANKLNTAKNCGDAMGCWYQDIYFLNGDPDYTISGGNPYDTAMNGHFGKAILSGGTLIAINDYQTGCTSSGARGFGGGPLTGATCGIIYVDINGHKGPNTIGRDWFVFHVTKTGIHPGGTYADGLTCEINEPSWQQNDGCTAKILLEGAMNY